MSRKSAARVVTLLLLSTPSFGSEPVQCPEGTTLKSRHNASSRFCELLSGADVIDAIQIRVLDGKNSEPAMTTVLKREDCAGPGP